MHLRLVQRSARPVPVEYRASFFHLYSDIAWFGVLAASAMAFVAVYAVRQGADAFQVGLLSAAPAIVNLALTLPAGRWLEEKPITDAVFWAAVFSRFVYLLWIPLPLLLPPQGQVWALIGLTLLMSIPGTALAVGFNALFADAVPPDWRGHVSGIRNALLAVIFILVSLLCGYLLDRLPFPTGYQVVFGIGFVGAVVSTFHLWFVIPRSAVQARPRIGKSLGDLAWPGRIRIVADGLRPGVGLRFLIRRRKVHFLRMDLLTSAFGKLLTILFAFHLAIQLALPLFPLIWVNRLHLSDQEIGLGTAVFYGCVFVGSTQLARLVQRLGNQRVTAIGAALMSSYPAFMALADGIELFLVGSAAAGLGWSLAGGALTNYLLEKVPEDHRPPYLAWYNLVLNAALLLGSLIGPVVAGIIGLPTALLAFAVLRFMAALGIMLWE
jgi:MFS family permease